MERRPPQPVDSPDRQRVAFPQRLQRRQQAGPRRFGPLQPLILKHPLAARRAKRVQLQVEILFIRRDTGITDFHGRNSKRPLLNGLVVLFSTTYVAKLDRLKGFRFKRPS